MSRRIECAKAAELCPTGCPAVDRLEQLRDAAGMEPASISPQRIEQVRADTKTFGCTEEAFVQAVKIVFNSGTS